MMIHVIVDIARYQSNFSEYEIMKNMNPRLRLGSIFFTLSSDFFLHILKSYSDIVQYLLLSNIRYLIKGKRCYSDTHVSRLASQTPPRSGRTGWARRCWGSTWSCGRRWRQRRWWGRSETAWSPWPSGGSHSVLHSQIIPLSEVCKEFPYNFLQTRNTFFTTFWIFFPVNICMVFCYFFSSMEHNVIFF